MSAILCFLLTPTARVVLKLRRYAGRSKCPSPMTYHNASIHFGIAEARFTEENYLKSCDQFTPPHDDPLWPKTCEGCSYEFQPGDDWQLFQELLYIRSDTGVEVVLRDAPAGAMWDAHWMPWKGSDGLSLMVMTPGGEWAIDGPSSGGGHWTRTGIAPKITARPSILIPGKYHGWLTDGVLAAC